MSSRVTYSPEIEPASPSTAVTTPEQQPHEEDDIWASDSPTTTTARDELLSDLPTVKRQHMTDGYREGLSVGKARVMQQGFDEGYPIGVQIAMRVGLILGILEGYLASKPISYMTDNKAILQKLYAKAKEELSSSALLRDVNDQLIAETQTIPLAIDAVISKWEATVLGTTNESEFL